MKSQKIFQIVAILTVIFTSWDGHSETTPNRTPDNLRGIAFTAGMLSGMGFAYRLYETHDKAHHIAGIMFGDTNSFESNLGYMNLNKMREYENSALYWLWGGSVFYATHKKSINVGSGFGMEFWLKPTGVRLAFELPLTVSTSFFDNETNFGIWPIPSASLIFVL